MPRSKQPFLIFGTALASLLLWLAFRNPAVTKPLTGIIDQLSNFTTIFLAIFIEAAAFLLFGTLASGLVEVFINQDDIARFIPRDPVRGALVGSLMGLLFPVCECGVVPLTRRLFKKGLPLSVGIAFLLAAPMFNPIVIASTIAAFGIGPLLFWRIGLTLAIATVTGLAFSTQKHPERLLRPVAWMPIGGGSGAAPVVAVFQRPGLRDGLHRTLVVAMDEFFEMGYYLIIGSLLASLMQTVVPQSALLSLGSGPVISVITLVTLAVLLSICSTVDAFIARTFIGTFTTGSMLAFLVYGPMVDIKSTLMFLGVFRPRAVVYLVLLPLAMTLFAAIALNLYTTW